MCTNLNLPRTINQTITLRQISEKIFLLIKIYFIILNVRVKALYKKSN